MDYITDLLWRLKGKRRQKVENLFHLSYHAEQINSPKQQQQQQQQQQHGFGRSEKYTHFILKFNFLITGSAILCSLILKTRIIMIIISE